MKIIQEQFSVSTKSRNQMVDITSRVQSIVGRILPPYDGGDYNQ